MIEALADGIEALAGLERFGTVSEAATRLRLTQSAVSKRLQALQRAVGFDVVAPEGRRLVITPEGLALLERARPLLAELRALVDPAPEARSASFTLALADSIAASWGPRVVAEALAELPGIQLALHAHRSVLVLESVRLGRYHIGLTTDAGAAPELLRRPLCREPMVLVHQRLAAAPAGGPLITIEPRSATWEAIERPLRRRQSALAAATITPVESFAAALQMARAGFGDGLVPLGLALEAGLPRGSYRPLAGVERPISLVTRKTVHHLHGYGALADALARAAARTFAAASGSRRASSD